MPLHAWSSAAYTVPLPPGHRFPIEKYALLRDRVIADGVIPAERVHGPERVRADEMRLVHTADYVERLTCGRLTESEIRLIGLPWSPHLVERSYRAVGGTLAAAGAALEHGVAMNLAGGTHHAFADCGEGYCVFNDSAIAARAMQAEGRAQRLVILDCDVHQGNGTAAVFESDPEVFTFSMHGAKNYPLFKQRSSLDVELADGTGDEEYLAALARHLPRAFDHGPEIVFYLGGADPYAGDKLGRLSLSIEGLRARDEMVLRECRARGVPVATVMSGGYAADIDDTVEIHCNTIRAVKAVFEGGTSSKFKVQS